MSPVEAAGGVDRHGLAVLDEDVCLRLLSTTAIGRLGLTANALPVILPINFALVGRTIVFATDDGLKLDAARAHHVACLEIDGTDDFRHGGWSVLATGRLGEITDAEERREAEAAPLRPWALPAAAHFIALPIDLLSGRRIPRP